MMSDFAEITYSAQQVICEHPRIIINPLLPELIAKYHSYYLRGHHFVDKRVHIHYFAFNYSRFSIKRNEITSSDIPTSFVVDESSGETFPIYIEVPCNHCDVCKSRKINSFVQRCKLETQVYDNKPWFCTLTFAPEFLPEKGCSVDMAQRFLKRFRINLERSGFNNHIRYVLVHEYGRRTHRTHCHAIFWNIGSKSKLDYLKVSKILRDSWSYGYVKRRVIDTENDKCFYYTAKYLRKDCVVPKGCNPVFMLSSRRHGGIGAPFLDSIKDDFRKRLDIHYKFLNKWTNKVEELCFSQYVLNRLLPSWSKSIPSDLRKNLAEFGLGASYYLNTFNDLFTQQISILHKKFNHAFSQYIYYPCLEFGDYNKRMLQTVCTTAQGLLRVAECIEHYGLPNFQEAEELHKKRGYFISRLFEHSPVVDISARSYRVKRQFAMAAAREIF